MLFISLLGAGYRALSVFWNSGYIVAAPPARGVAGEFLLGAELLEERILAREVVRHGAARLIGQFHDRSARIGRKGHPGETLSFPWKREPMYGMFEYACHEGNYAMRNMLSISRAAEKESSAR